MTESWVNLCNHCSKQSAYVKSTTWLLFMLGLEEKKGVDEQYEKVFLIYLSVQVICDDQW